MAEVRSGRIMGEGLEAPGRVVGVGGHRPGARRPAAGPVVGEIGDAGMRDPDPVAVQIVEIARRPVSGALCAYLYSCLVLNQERTLSTS